MNGILSELRYNATMIWRRSSFSQWLLGVGLLTFVWLLLYSFGGAKANRVGNHVAKADSCLQAAGSDLKRGELLVHEMGARPCGCTAVN
jgi:hypothetical protein